MTYLCLEKISNSKADWIAKTEQVPGEIKGQTNGRNSINSAEAHGHSRKIHTITRLLGRVWRPNWVAILTKYSRNLVLSKQYLKTTTLGRDSRQESYREV